MHVPWQEFFNAINFSADNTITFLYVLQVVELVEFEYSGPPLALVDKIVKTDNNDITRAVQLASKNDTVDWTRQGREEMKAQLLSRDLFLKQMATLESYFDLNHQEKMLKYHNNFNVFTPDNLFHWQCNTIDQVIGKVTKQQPQQSLVKISENVRKKMHELKWSMIIH